MKERIYYITIIIVLVVLLLGFVVSNGVDFSPELEQAVSLEDKCPKNNYVSPGTKDTIAFAYCKGFTCEEGRKECLAGIYEDVLDIYGKSIGHRFDCYCP